MALAAACAVLVACAGLVQAKGEQWKINEIYSDTLGSVQFIELSTSASGQQQLRGNSITVTQGGVHHSFTFQEDRSGDSANRKLLIATHSFYHLGLVTPDYLVDDGFLFLGSGTINYADFDIVPYSSLPADGIHSLDRNNNPAVNSPTNYAGATGTVTSLSVAPAALENPQPNSYQSGIGLISGWSCNGPDIVAYIDANEGLALPYGSARADTASVCGAGNTATGFGLLLNYNTLKAGTHEIHLLVNGVPVAFTTFAVNVPNGEFITGATRDVDVADFPVSGAKTVLTWQQSQQNFAIKSVAGAKSDVYPNGTGALAPGAKAATTSALENPQPDSYQSGIGLISGWSCTAGAISASVDGAGPLTLPYGSARADTAAVCGAANTNTGFGLLLNYNTLGPGTHSVQLLVNGVPAGSTQFTVTVPAGEFMTGMTSNVAVPDFPLAGKTTTLTWQQSQQNFAIKSVTGQ
jgi:hypothetical protein